MVWFLADDRTISTTRLWIARVLVVLGGSGSTGSIIQQGGVMNAGAAATGAAVGLAAVYWALLRVLSRPDAGSDPAPDTGEPAAGEV